MGRLTNRVAIVTGAADGMGLAITDLFVKEGARVLATDINASKLGDAHRNKSDVRTVSTDIAVAGAAEEIVEQAVAAFGGLHILVNAAGMYESAIMEEVTRDHWDRILAVNLTGPMELCVRAIPEMKKAGYGRIINVASINAKLARSGSGAYCVSKHGVAGLTISLAVELGKYGITANYINPGTIRTGMTRPYLTDPEWKRYFENQGVLGRIGEADEIAHAALYLADETSGFTTGHGLTVDGGYTAGFDDGGLISKEE